jgi:phenylacetaldehyde dehydrogenase
MMTVPELLPATRAFLAKPARMLIGGQWREASSGETLPSIDPATGKVLGVIPSGTAVDADEAVRSARRAVPAWKKVTPYDRGRLLQKAAALMERHGDELAELITLENGKPLWEAKKEVGTAVSWTEYYAGWTLSLIHI